MRDEIEKFVHEHRETFDSHMPGEHIWQQIEQELEPAAEVSKTKGKQMYVNWLWKAAAMLFFGLFAALLVERQYNQELDSKLAERDKVPGLSEFLQTEAYYTSLIQQKRKQIAHFASRESYLVEDFTKDLESLDSMYVVLKEDLKVQQTDRVVDAMIQNLQLRIDILNRQLNILEGIQRNKENHEEQQATLI